MQKNYYEILEVSENASPEVIEKAYKALVKKYHPDLQPEGKKQESENKIKIINEAYDILSDTTKKADYDNKLKSQKMQAERAKYEQMRREQQSVNTSPSTSNITNNTVHSQPSPQKRPIKSPEQTQKNNLSNDQFINNAAVKDAYNDAYQKAYQKAYIDNLKSMGYEIKYEKTFKEHLQSFFSVVFAIIVLIIVCIILWHIPPIKNYLINLYNSNEIIKLLVDIAYSFFSNLISLFKR